ncbi:MAG TPA: TcpE family conjugal transfer membrane protein [Solirubrobacteraceae bacterium]|nr:TcpE family conjugal transfer membrane protein [Solirubrobacteraceae bacterium]
MSDEARRGAAIRSFRVVFELERRIHKVDRIRLPLPYGLPLRSLAYAVVAFVAVVALARLPLVGELVGAVPAPVRLAVIPALIAYALTQLRPDGRPAHWFLLAWARQRLAPSTIVSLAPVRPRPTERLGELLVAPDEREVRYRPAVIEGPAVVLLRLPVEPRARGKTLELRSAAKQPLYRGRRLAMSSGQRAVLR